MRVFVSIPTLKQRWVAERFVCLSESHHVRSEKFEGSFECLKKEHFQLVQIISHFREIKWRTLAHVKKDLGWQRLDVLTGI